MNGGWGQENQQATAKSWLEMTKKLGKWVGGAESPCSFPASTCGSQPPETTVPGDLMPADTRHACD